MKQLSEQSLTEKQFAQLIGRARLYNFLPKDVKSQILELMLTDGQISTVAKDYYLDNSFYRNENGDINLWKANAINGDSNHHWFLS